MLDLIEEGASVATGSGRLQPVSKAAVFSEFIAPLDLEEEIAARDAEVPARHHAAMPDARMAQIPWLLVDGVLVSPEALA